MYTRDTDTVFPEIEIGEWKPSDKQLLERTVTYIKPLNGSIGPKSMKCYITDANENVDFDDYISVLTTTRTPDAPSGNAFAIKTRTCFTWAPNNCCRVQVTTTVEWTKSSFLKGTLLCQCRRQNSNQPECSGVITSSALEGQKTYHADLVKVIKTYMHKHKSEFQHSSGGEDIDDTVADAVDDEPELAVPVETNASSTSTLKQVAETSVEAAKGAVGFLVEAATGNSIATAIIAILFVFNLWTLLISRSSSDAELLPGSRARAPPGSHLRSGDDVADAVRRVLGEYFAPPHLHTRQVPTAAPVMADTDPTQELEDIFTALEDLEGRVARLRTLLTNQEVTEN